MYQQRDNTKKLTLEDLKLIKEKFDVQQIPKSEITNEQYQSMYNAMRCLREEARKGNEESNSILKSIYG